MAEPKPPKTTAKPKPHDRGDRLAAALRDNLKRRKAQARAQSETSEPPVPAEKNAKNR